MKLLVNSSHGHQFMEPSRYTVTKYLGDEKTHAASYNQLLKKLDHVNNSLHEVELINAQIEQKEPIIVGLFILIYARLRLVKLYYNFWNKCFDVNKLEQTGKETNSLSLALAKMELENCIPPKMKIEWE